MYLAVSLTKIIDIEAKPARKDPHGEVIVKAIDEKSHIEVAKVYIENKADDVARNVKDGVSVEYYKLIAKPGSVKLERVK